ncbi:MAG: alpha/beta fold hydrolase [Pseudomonadota bacterium]
MLAYSLDCSDSDRPLVIYLHGLGMAGWCWQPVADQLNGYGALIPDMPGHGGSAGIEWRSLTDSAQQVARVVDSMAPDRKIFLTGHSLGAYVGFILLSLRPNRFEGAMLSGFHVGHLKAPLLWKTAYMVNSVLMRMPLMTRLMKGRFATPDMALKFQTGIAQIRARTIRQGGFDVIAFRPPEIDQVSCPILAVAADREPKAIRRMPETLAARYPVVRGLVLKGRDHLWPLEDPDHYVHFLRHLIEATDDSIAALDR